MSNHKTKRRDGPNSDYVRPLTAEEKARPVVIHPLPNYYDEYMAWGNRQQDHMVDMSLHAFRTYKRLEAERAPYSVIEPYAIAIAALLGLDDPIATPKIAPAKAKAPAILPQALQDVNDVLEQNARKSPVSTQYRELVETTLEAYVKQANGHPIRITADNFIKREQTEVRMYCRFLENDDRDGFLVGVALNSDDPARPVYKGTELLAYLELCHKAGEEFRKRMVGKPSVPPFRCQLGQPTAA